MTENSDYVADLFVSGLDTLKSQKTWPAYDGKVLDRTVRLNASEAIGCPRRLAYEKSGVPPVKNTDDKDWSGVQHRGDAIEALVIKAIIYALPKHKELLFAGDNQRSFYFANMSATMDGLIADHNEKTLAYLEVKSIDPRSNLEAMTGPRDKHKWQMITGAHVLGEIIACERLGNVYPELKGYQLEQFGHIIYVDANDVKRTRSFAVDFDAEHVYMIEDKIVEKSKILFPFGQVAKPEDMNAEGVATGDCTYCGYKGPCSAYKQFFNPEANNFKVVGRGKRNTHVSLFKDYFVSTVALSDAKARMEDLQDQIKEAIQTQGTRREKTLSLTAGDYTASLVEVSGRTTLDKAAVAKRLGVKELPADLFKTGAPSQRFDFKESK